MGGGGESEATRCGTCVVGTPMEPRAHPANQHAATWVAGEARGGPATFHSSYAHPNQSGGGGGGENPYVHVAPLNAPAPSGRSPMWEEVRRRYAKCRDARGQYVWHHLRTNPSITTQQWLDWLRGQKYLQRVDRIRYFSRHLRFCQERSFCRHMLAIYPLPLGLSLGHCICQTRDWPSAVITLFANTLPQDSNSGCIIR